MRDEELQHDLRELDGEAFLAKREPKLYSRIVATSSMSHPTNGNGSNGHATINVTDIVKGGVT